MSGTSTVDRRKVPLHYGEDEDSPISFSVRPVVQRKSRIQPSTASTSRVAAYNERVTDDFDQDTDDRSPHDIPMRSGRSSPHKQRRRSTSSRSGSRMHLHWLVTLGAGMFILVALYIICYWFYLLGVQTYDRWNYGPVATFHLDAAVGDQDSAANPTQFIATNQHGKIVVVVIPGGNVTKATTYLTPALSDVGWGSLDDLVATLEVEKGTGNLLVHIQGDPDISHFYQRPKITFVLTNTRPGFKLSSNAYQ